MDRRAHGSETPEERATRLANVMLDALGEASEYDEEVRAIALVYPNTGRGGVGLHGEEYRDVERAVSDALQSLDALLQTVGKSLRSFEIPSVGGQG